MLHAMVTSLRGCLLLRALCGQSSAPAAHRATAAVCNRAGRAVLQPGAHRRSRSFTKRAASAKTSPPRPAPQPDIMTRTSVRPMRRCLTYSRAGSWSRVTQWMHSTGHVSIDSCVNRVGLRVYYSKIGPGSGTAGRAGRQRSATALPQRAGAQQALTVIPAGYRFQHRHHPACLAKSGARAAAPGSWAPSPPTAQTRGCVRTRAPCGRSPTRTTRTACNRCS